MLKIILTALPLALLVSAYAQPQPVLTAKDYEQAQRFLGPNAEQLIDNGPVRPNWLPDNRFWYRNLTANGSEFILVDPAKGTRTTAFDARKLASSLSKATGNTYEATRLPFQRISFAPDKQAIMFQAGGKSWQYTPQSDQLTRRHHQSTHDQPRRAATRTGRQW